MSLYESTLETPLGSLRLLASDRGLAGIYFEQHKNMPLRQALPDDLHPLLEKVKVQLRQYFEGTRRRFEIPLDPQGTDFQKDVWSSLTEIPYGQTQSYGELASRLGKPLASRAVGRANGLNPVSIIIPCHRVVGASGKLTGYAGGLETKQWLLEHESRSLSE